MLGGGELALDLALVVLERRRRELELAPQRARLVPRVASLQLELLRLEPERRERVFGARQAQPTLA